MISEQTIEEVKNRIVENFHPEKIILFGSYANGNATDDSDLDLLIIKKTDLPKGKRIGDLRFKLKEFKVPMDLLVYTPEEVEYWKDTSMAFVTGIINSGKLIYG